MFQEFIHLRTFTEHSKTLNATVEKQTKVIVEVMEVEPTEEPQKEEFLKVKPSISRDKERNRARSKKTIRAVK
jgi:hypothetical protein